MFAAFKVIVAFVLACASVVAAVVEYGHPAFFACLGGAFVVGVIVAEVSRALRQASIRSNPVAHSQKRIWPADNRRLG